MSLLLVDYGWRLWKPCRKSRKQAYVISGLDFAIVLIIQIQVPEIAFQELSQHLAAKSTVKDLKKIGLVVVRDVISDVSAQAAGEEIRSYTQARNGHRKFLSSLFLEMIVVRTALITSYILASVATRPSCSPEYPICQFTGHGRPQRQGSQVHQSLYLIGSSSAPIADGKNGKALERESFLSVEIRHKQELIASLTEHYPPTLPYPLPELETIKSHHPSTPLVTPPSGHSSSLCTLGSHFTTRKVISTLPIGHLPLLDILPNRNPTCHT